MAVHDIDIALNTENHDLLTLAQDELALVRIRRVRLVIHVHAVEAAVVLDSNDKDDGRKVGLFLSCSKIDADSWITRAAGVAREAHVAVTYAVDVWLDPLLFHGSAAPQQERAS